MTDAGAADSSANATVCSISGSTYSPRHTDRYSGVTVTAYDEEGRVVLTTTSDETLAYVLSPLSPGTYRVGFSHAATNDFYLPQFFDGAATLADATPITLTEDSPTRTDVDGGVVHIGFKPSPMAHDDGTWSTAQTLPCHSNPTNVAVSGDTAVVCIPSQPIWLYEEPSAPLVCTGIVYVYVRESTGWRLQQRIISPDAKPREHFGCSIGLDGDTMAIGQLTYELTEEPGKAYVFVRHGSTWRLQARLTGSGVEACRRGFGQSVAVSGDTIVVGASGARIGNRARAGAAYVFTRSGHSWTETQRLTADPVHAHACFGSAVAVERGTLVSGAPSDRTGGIGGGSAYVFRRRDNEWSQVARLRPENPHSADAFGSPLDLSGDSLAVSAPGRGGRGAVFVMVRTEGAWRQQAELSTRDTPGDYFGRAIDISGDALLIGWSGLGPWTYRAGTSGAAYYFVRRDGTWHRRARMGRSEKPGQAGVGTGVAIANDDLIVLPYLDSSGDEVGRYAVRIYRPYLAEAGEPLRVPTSRGVLSNDAAPNDETLTARLLSSPVHGTVDLAADGSFQYTPAPQFVGTDTFTYRAESATWTSSPATATVSVDDSTAPVVDIGDIGSQWVNTPVTVVLSATDATKVSRVQYRSTSAKRWRLYRRSFSVRRQGITRFIVRATDTRGNTRRKRFSVRLDSRRPCVRAPHTAIGTAGGRVTFRFMIADPRPGAPWADVRIDVYKGRACQGSAILRRQKVNRLLTRRLRNWLQPGRYRFVITAKDAAGNPQRRAATNTLVVR